MKKSSLLFFIPFTLVLLGLTSVETKDTQTDMTTYLNRLKREAWVDSVFNTFSEDDKIAQLFMLAVEPSGNPRVGNEISTLIKKYKIGGLVFFKGMPTEQAQLTNRFQSELNIPALVAIDGEWGLGMRLDSTISFPYQMALGAIQDDNLIYEMGIEIGRECKRIGIHINFAPVADVNNNAKNPVINYRSFGENKIKVASKAYAYMKGMQDIGLITSAKHFPGHGDTDVDSHYGLPVIKHNIERLDDIELYPFKELINKGLNGVMVAHMNIPALDATPNLPTTLSKPVITHLLREKLGFKGLIFTDAMRMKGVTAYHPVGEAEVKALLAGIDIIELSENTPKAIEAIKSAVKTGVIKQEDIDTKCKKVLTAKYDLGFANFQKVNLQNLIADLNTDPAKELHRKLSAATLTLLKNDQSLLPLRNIEKQKIAVISIGAIGKTKFQTKIGEFAKTEDFSLPMTANANAIKKVSSQLKKFDLVIIALHDTQKRPNNKVEYSSDLINFVGELAKNPNAIITVLKNPYTLAKFKNIEVAKQLVMLYYDSEIVQEVAADFIFGKSYASGKIPVTVGSFKAGDGIEIK
jgi:beta-glucosidase-like glycosyl hydrolase